MDVNQHNNRNIMLTRRRQTCLLCNGTYTTSNKGSHSKTFKHLKEVVNAVIDYDLIRHQKHLGLVPFGQSYRGLTFLYVDGPAFLPTYLPT